MIKQGGRRSHGSKDVVEKNDAVRTTDLFSDQLFDSAKIACEEMLARYELWLGEDLQSERWGVVWCY